MKAPLIAHIILNLDVGGLETGLVNLINHMPDRYRHVIICLGHASEFRNRISRSDVEVYELHKREGKDFALYFRLWKLLRRLKPDIVHTRDFAALDSVAVVALAGVRYRVHSLHGWYMKHTRKYQVMHRTLRRMIHYHITVSQDLADWLQSSIGVPAEQTQAICNGVDAETFHPASEQSGLGGEAGGEFGSDKFIVGTVGRLVAVKDQITLIKAFAEVSRQQQPELSDRLRLTIIGDGPLSDDLAQAVEQEGIQSKTWLPGSRDDVAELMRGMNVFVLPSLSEGISNTILEAMASGLPVIATAVGGSPELIREGETGQLVPISNSEALARAIKYYVQAPKEAFEHGLAGRRRVDDEFSMEAMAVAYTGVYDVFLTREKVTDSAPAVSSRER